MHDPSAGVKALDGIVETRRDLCHGGSTHAMDLLQEIDRRGRHDPWRGQGVLHGRLADPTETARRLLALGAKPQNVYGMTENGSHQYTKPNDPAEVITGSVGKACAGYEIRLWQADSPDLEARPRRRR